MVLPDVHECQMANKDAEKLKLTWCLKSRLISGENPHGMHYFRSDLNVRKEQERHLMVNKYAIHPFSKFRAWYEMYLLYLYSSVLVTKPIDASFMTINFFNSYVVYHYYSLFTDFLCLVDIFITFFTGYDLKKERMVELRISHIAKNYILSPYFFCDLVSSIPKTLPYYIPIWWIRYIYGLIGLFCLFKIIRLITVVKYMKKTAEYFRIQSKVIIFLLCSTMASIFVIHYMACLQVAVPKLIRRSFRMVKDQRGWFLEYGLFRRPLIIQYLHSFFKASACILSIRLVIYSTNLPEEFAINIATYIVGKILIAFIWVILAVAILNSRSIEIKFAEIINQLEEYIKQKQLPPNLRNRILQYFNFKYQRKFYREDLIQAMLSDNIKNNVNLHVCKLLIDSVSLFNDLTVNEINKIVEFLVPEVFLPHDVIVQAGTEGKSMYFLSSGTVAVYSRSGKEICHLQEGAYFGEISLVLKNQISIMTVVAIEPSHVYRLTKRGFERCLLTNKKLMQRIIKNAEMRLKEISEAEENYRKLLFEQTYLR